MASVSFGNFCSNPRYNGTSRAAEKSAYVSIKILDFVEDHFRSLTVNKLKSRQAWVAGGERCREWSRKLLSTLSTTRKGNTALMTKVKGDRRRPPLKRVRSFATGGEKAGPVQKLVNLCKGDLGWLLKHHYTRVF